MSETTEGTFKVPLTTILEINEHPGADRLEVAKIYGFDVVVKKSQYIVCDVVLYAPVDSILSRELEYHLFPEDSKIKLNKGRIRQIRIRKLASQGMLISPDDIKTVYNFTPDKLETCYMSKVKIAKYEPPAPKFQKQGGNVRKVKKLENHHFQKYNGLTNIKWAPFMFKEGEIVTYQEKVHGSQARASKMPFAANTIMKKIKKFFGLTPAFEFCYGSNNVQLQERDSYTGFYGENVYGKVFQEIEAEKKIKEGEAIYGELYGEGIQKNYHYEVRGKHKFILFDVKKLNEDGSQRWLDPDEVIAYAKERGFDMVPELYRGPYSGLDHAKEFTLGASVLAPSQKVREGIVVKAVNGYSDERGSKRALKAISEKYLDKADNTDFH